jgi:hypothetical protein
MQSLQVPMMQTSMQVAAQPMQIAQPMQQMQQQVQVGGQQCFKG